MRVAIRILVSIALGCAIGLLFVTPASAATTYTWSGDGDTDNWSEAANWSPAGVPGPADTASIDSRPGTSTIEVDGSVSVASLSVAESATNISLSGSGSLTVTGALSWTGGDILVPLTLAEGATGAVDAGFKQFGNEIADSFTVAGDLELSDETGVGDPVLTFYFDADLVVTPTGSLTTATENVALGANRCCSPPTSTLVNEGTITTIGTLRLDHLELDQRHTVVIPPGSAIEIDGGPAYNSPDARYTGGGTIRVRSTPNPGWDQSADAIVGGFVIDERLQLDDGALLQVQDRGSVAGVGDIAGNGEIMLDGGTWYAESTLEPAVRFYTAAGTRSVLAAWDSDVPGLHADLTVGETAGVSGFSALRVNSSTRLSVPTGSRFSVQKGATLESGSCCSDATELLVADGGELVIGDGPPANRLDDDDPGNDPALLEWVRIGGKGTIRVAGNSEWDLPALKMAKGSRLIGAGRIDGDVDLGKAAIRPSGPLVVTGDLQLAKASTVVVDVTGKRKPHVTNPIKVGDTANLAGRLQVRGKTWEKQSAKAVLIQYDDHVGRFASVTKPKRTKMAYRPGSLVLSRR